MADALEVIARYESGQDATVRARAAAWARLDTARGCVLVEGVSDQIAVDLTAAALGIDLAGSGVVVVPIGGAQAITKVVSELRGRRSGLTLVGLCDAAERSFFERALPTDRVFVCVDDLEDELLRAAGPDLVARVIDGAGEARSFERFRSQAPWRNAPVLAQAHRFIRSRSGRNQRYAVELIEALDPEHIPTPLVHAVHVAVR